ncbi:gamma carbonic anhydrase family protein [Brasilonema octagenarum UFV-E1]|uniref:Gamma carbonic anhydrase family protein n=1 Tax=Brasilonema sennae CENA114 TaxID=415709 RepID=A0A856MBE5_9CYAN|nr:gamma carbonic anhydrase family protein [Brasilonema sennae CENA114]QDL14931.1 gamma carbonic anhydrase family protein [Brasilonema octagenarum UFV-E1]
MISWFCNLPRLEFLQCSWVPHLYSTVSIASYWSSPDISQAAFIAANAIVMGSVKIAAGVSIWYGAVVRADVESIEIGECTNIQDGAILHGDPGKPTVLEDHVTVGHRAVVHSAYIEHGSLIGIGAVVLDGVRVGSGSIIGAGAVVTKDVPPLSLVVGVPGKVVRQISEAEAAELIEHAERYKKLALVHAGKGTDIGFEAPE